MCGIAGILRLNPDATPFGRDALERMVHTLDHRGPDGRGYFLDGEMGLGHARLSIIDLGGGAQPIHNENRTVWTVFNGEIFNYIELRSELESLGHRFYTNSDTEVIVHLYEEYGLDFPAYLNGQFAIAVWDQASRQLVLTRDRAGILPLFYAEFDDRLYFASESKAIFAGAQRKPSMDSSALDQIMTFWAPVGPRSIFSGVREVLPGELIRIKDGKREHKRYWGWTYPEDGVYRRGTEAELSSELHDLLVDATRIRLRADVPVGAYLSGGLDSSVLVSMIHHYGGVPLRTFSIGFEDKGLDESSYQSELIRHLGADHSRIECRSDDVGLQFLESLWYMETPVLRTAPIPMGMLSGLVRDENYKVVLTGEGSDEVLGGYDIFKEAKIRRFWSRFPDSEIRPFLLRRLYPYLETAQSQALPYLRNFFGTGLDAPDQPFFSHLPRWLTTAKTKEFFSEEFKAMLKESAMEEAERSLPENYGAWDPFNRSQYLEARGLMSGYLLSAQGDRMLMKNSVEGRFPFLDHRVIEFANSIDPRLKMKVLNEKYLLKGSMRDYLPKSILNRYKQPYRAPDIAAFTGVASEVVDDLMSSEALKRSGYFDSRKVERLVKKARSGRAIGYKDNMAFVGILSSQAWHRLFVEEFDERSRYRQSRSERGASDDLVVDQMVG